MEYFLERTCREHISIYFNEIANMTVTDRIINNSKKTKH